MQGDQTNKDLQGKHREEKLPQSSSDPTLWRSLTLWAVFLSLSLDLMIHGNTT